MFKTLPSPLRAFRKKPPTSPVLGPVMSSKSFDDDVNAKHPLEIALEAEMKCKEFFQILCSLVSSENDEHKLRLLYAVLRYIEGTPVVERIAHQATARKIITTFLERGSRFEVEDFPRELLSLDLKTAQEIKVHLLHNLVSLPEVVAVLTEEETTQEEKEESSHHSSQHSFRPNNNNGIAWVDRLGEIIQNPAQRRDMINQLMVHKEGCKFNAKIRFVAACDQYLNSKVPEEQLQLGLKIVAIFFAKEGMFKIDVSKALERQLTVYGKLEELKQARTEVLIELSQIEEIVFAFCKPQ